MVSRSAGRKTSREPNHAWNAVKIQERWHLVDVTWDAGHIEGKIYHKQYGTAYLFADPRQFLYTHFPTDAKWQLLQRPMHGGGVRGTAVP